MRRILPIFIMVMMTSGITFAQDGHPTPYQIALERIGVVQRTNGTVLILDDINLDAVPPEIGQLNNLRYLLLGNNRLTELPPELWQLNTLEVLKLAIPSLTHPTRHSIRKFRNFFNLVMQLGMMAPKLAT